MLPPGDPIKPTPAICSNTKLPPVLCRQQPPRLLLAFFQQHQVAISFSRQRPQPATACYQLCAFIICIVATPSCYPVMQATASMATACMFNSNTKLPMASAGNGPTWPLLAISRARFSHPFCSNAKLLPCNASNSPHGYCLHFTATPSCRHRMQATAPNGYCLQLCVSTMFNSSQSCTWPT